MSSYKEMKAKTVIKVLGVVDQIVEYYSEKTQKTYYSVDLLVNGVRDKLNVKLPDDYDRTKLVEGELASFNIRITSYNNRITFNAA